MKSLQRTLSNGANLKLDTSRSRRECTKRVKEAPLHRTPFDAEANLTKIKISEEMKERTYHSMIESKE